MQIYNAAEALPNLINPFWKLPLLGVMGIRARDVVGLTFLQLLVHLPGVLFLLWLLARTLPYVPLVLPEESLASVSGSAIHATPSASAEITHAMSRLTDARGFLPAGRGA